MEYRFHCKEREEPVGVAYYDYILPITSAIAAISMLPPIFVYFRGYIKKKIKSSKCLFYAGLVMFIAIVLQFTGLIFMQPAYCRNMTLYLALEGPLTLIWAVQTQILLQILFFRLKLVFDDTSFALSKCLVRSWFTVFAIIVGSYLLALTFFVSQNIVLVALGGLLLVVSAVFAAFAAVWLMALFIQRLMRVHRLLDGDQIGVNNDRMVNAVTKNAVLCFASTTTNILLNFVLIPTSTFTQSIHFDFLFRLVYHVDVYTNFLAVLLTFGHFDNLYQRLCGCCHSMCFSWCADRFGKEKAVIATIASEVPVAASNTAQQSDAKTQTVSELSADPETTTTASAKTL
mmetsp:Transcript_27036/g.44388  ORF Transcript_27036/g.44388 Transcript_27036/m.44388 type:complete len:344 (+) Transcript_27036:53-1084(+)